MRQPGLFRYSSVGSYNPFQCNSWQAESYGPLRDHFRACLKFQPLASDALWESEGRGGNHTCVIDVTVMSANPGRVPASERSCCMQAGYQGADVNAMENLKLLLSMGIEVGECASHQ